MGPRLLATCLIVVTLLLAAAGPSGATARKASFALQGMNLPPHRSYFVYDARPGTTQSGSVRVVNAGTASGTVVLFPVDATTGQTSGLVYLSRESPRRDVGAWIRMSRSSVTLRPGRSAIVGFSVTVPAGARLRPGQHVGGIVAEDLRQATQTNGSGSGSSFQINIDTQAIVAIEVNLPGRPVERMRITGVSVAKASTYQTLLLGLSNTGREIVKPRGSLVASGAGGRVVQRFRLKMDSILPRTQIQYPLFVRGRPLGPGTYGARVTLKYGDGHVARYQGSFTVSGAPAKVFGSPAPSAVASPAKGSGAVVVVLAIGLVGALGGGITIGALLAPRGIRLRPVRSGGDGQGEAGRAKRARKPKKRKPARPARSGSSWSS